MSQCLSYYDLIDGEGLAHVEICNLYVSGLSQHHCRFEVVLEDAE